MLTEEQRLLRQSGIGASDIGVLLGTLKEYKSPLDLYFEKTGQVESADLSEVEPVIWGNLLEDDIAERYAQIYEVELEEPSTIVHPKYPYILATPDRLIKGQKKGVEIKTVGIHAFKKWGTPADRRIPENYFMQVMQCMYVMDYDSWDLAALFGGQELQVYTFERDNDFDKIIEKACGDFWNNHVAQRIPPPIDYDYPNVETTLKKLYNEIEEKVQVDLDASTENWVKVWQEAKEQAKNYNTIVKNAQAHILGTLKNAQIGMLPDGSRLVRKQITTKAHEVKGSSYVRLDFKGNK